MDRRTLIESLMLYKDPIQMMARYGITPSQDQIETVEQAIRNARNLLEKDLRSITSVKCPYMLTEDQRYDSMMHKYELTMTQQMLWNTIKQHMINNPNARKNDAECIFKALKDMEGLIQINMYVGEFQENRRLLNDDDPDYVYKLFATCYAGHFRTRPQPQGA